MRGKRADGPVTTGREARSGGRQVAGDRPRAMGDGHVAAGDG